MERYSIDHEAAHVIVMLSDKGGVGKTTCAVSVAHGLARQSANVLLVDLDRQGQDATSLGLSPEMCVFNLLVLDDPIENQYRATGRDRLTLLPGNRTTERAEVPQSRFDGSFVAAYARFDYVIFDTSAHGQLRQHAATAADTVVVLAGLDALELDGVRMTMEELKSWNPGAQQIILPNNYDRRLSIHKQGLIDLSDAFDGFVMRPVPSRVEVKELPSAGETIWEYCPKSDVIGVYEELLDWITRDIASVLFEGVRNG